MCSCGKGAIVLFRGKKRKTVSVSLAQSCEAREEGREGGGSGLTLCIIWGEGRGGGVILGREGGGGKIGIGR